MLSSVRVNVDYHISQHFMSVHCTVQPNYLFCCYVQAYIQVYLQNETLQEPV